MNITKEQVTKLLDFVEAYAGVSPEHECATILRGLSDAEPVNRCITELLAFAKDHPGTYIFPSWDGSRVMKYLATSPQAAQTEADELLRKWNLDPDLYRTDSGALNHMKIAAALKHPDDYPHTAQTAVKSESLAQAAQALAQPPSEGKTIEALAPTEAALSEVVRQSEDAGLYGADFQTGRAGSKG